jgi:CDP-paratose 2-epimerase
MRVAVTGAGGFIGSHAAVYMAERGHDVVAIDDLSRGKLLGLNRREEHNWNYLSKKEKVTLKLQDITEPGLDGIEDCDAIIHAAAQTAATASLKDPVTDMRVNLVGTLNVLEAARKARTEPALVFCSTNKVYGDNVNRLPIRENLNSYSFAENPEGLAEDFPVDRTGHTPYGASKLAADIYVQEYAHTYGLRTSVFRQSCIYGPMQFGVEDQGWVAWLAIAAILGKEITVYGDGKQVRDALYVEDLCRGLDLAINKAKEVAGEVFNIGGGPRNTLSVLGLLGMLEEMAGRKLTWRYGDWRPHDQKVYISDIRKAKAKLGWEPTVSPEAGVRRLVSWVQTSKELFR